MRHAAVRMVDPDAESVEAQLRAGQRGGAGRDAVPRQTRRMVLAETSKPSLRSSYVRGR